MLLAMLVAAAVSFASTPMVKALACKVGAIDVPKDNRRMHKVPIPRMGGLAIFLAFLLSVLVFADIDRQMQGILLGSIMIVILGVLDDIMALKALPKLFVQIAAAGVRILGGCCGTTPAHIAALCAELDALPQQTEAAPAAKLSTGTAPAVEKDDAFLRKLNAGEKVIAIELDSPRVADLSGYLDGARRLQAAGADLLTIADCPIAQARMDSSLVACRVHRELGMCALPHMTCRDRNLNATKALLLGLYAEGVREVLAITGDPIPTAERDEVKNVYQFNSRKLAQYIVSLAGEGREMPSAMTVLGALNLNARNFDVELRRAVEKLENGMSGFLTQPVLSAQAVENLRKARQTLGERAKILVGIMPVVSQRNAIFMENEINGIHVEEDIIQRFAGLDREQGEALGLEVSMQMAREALPYADGFYLMTPFNRVALMERLIARLKTELLDAEG